MGLNKVQLAPLCDLGDYFQNREAIATASIGPRGELSILTVVDSPDYFHRGNDVHSRETSYRALFFKDNNLVSTEIKNETWNYHFLQPINDSEFLLVCGRSNYYGQDKYDLNARVFNYNGVFRRDFLLGDGIQDLKVTSDGLIWTSYFDEGIFGNNGWNSPIGSSGLRAWNINGNPLYSYDAPTSEDYIVDCYALNVVSSKNVWFYYYDSFKLGQVKNNMVKLWNTEISGTNGLVMFDKYVLFCGSYEKRDTYYLYQMNYDRLSKIIEIKYLDEDENDLNSNIIDCRGNSIILCKGTKIYKFVLDNDFIWGLGKYIA